MIELTAPALFLAGLASSPHCSLMCGPLQSLQVSGREAHAVISLNAGRVAGYALLGAAAGALGQVFLGRLAGVASGTAIQLLAALVLLVAGLLRLRRARPSCRAASTRCRPARRLPLWLRGIAWAAMPCTLLYAMVGLATFSGGAAAGALLLAAFGLGTLPLTAGSGALLARLRGSRNARLGRAAGASMIALALASAWFTLEASAMHAGAWCAPIFR